MKDPVTLAAALTCAQALLRLAETLVRWLVPRDQVRPARGMAGQPVQGEPNSEKHAGRPRKQQVPAVGEGR